MTIENTDAKNRERELKERADEHTIRHETIPGESGKTHPSNADKTSAKEKASHSTADDDLN
jgi:hypothetical protein